MHKKLIVLLLLPLFLLATTIGVRVVSHYCGGKLSEKGLSVKVCCKDGLDSGCCKSESVLLKVNDHFIQIAQDVNFNELIKIEFLLFEFSYVPHILQISYLKPDWDKAPPNYFRYLYIKNRILII